MRPDFGRAPFLVIWEATRACQLVCRHCRAEACTHRHPEELATAEALDMLDHVRDAFGRVLLVITGGDPLERADLDAVIRHGDAVGLRMAITPSATPLLTPDRIAAFHRAGIKRMALSLDGADPATHDDFRGVGGTFSRTMRALETAGAIGLETQLNTTIGRHNEGQLAAIADIGAWHRIRLWSVFLLVATGRARRDMMLDPREQERMFQRLASIAEDPDYPFDVKTTAGQPYYRVRAQRMRRRLGADAERSSAQGLRAPASVNDGKGIVFVDHRGTVQPSGFLPLDCGNVRERPLADIYRDHPTFRRLRDPDAIAGKCGRCEFRELCGGSRSRAYALENDAFASDPTCLYRPRRQAQPTRR